MRRLLALGPLLLSLSACGAERPPPYNSTGDTGTLPPTDAPPGPVDVPLDVLPPPRGASPYPTSQRTLVLPYLGPEQSYSLEVSSAEGRLDVQLSVDTTGSFSGEIDSLQRELGTVVLPALGARVSDLAVGVSRFADFPVSPFGNPADRVFDLLTPVTTDSARVRAAVDRLDPLQHGGDGPEAWLDALFQIATGQGLRSGGVEFIPVYVPTSGVPGGGTAGGVGFRAGAARVVVNVTDAPSHVPEDYHPAITGTHGLDPVAAALRAAGARLLGIASGAAARPQLEALARATGATVPAESGRCTTGIDGASRAPDPDGTCPLVFDISSDGRGLARTLVEAIARFLDGLVYREVYGEAREDPQGFVTAIEALRATVPAGGTEPARVDRFPEVSPDGVPDTFTGVNSRTQVVFRVRLRNTRVPEGEHPRVFFVRVVLLGDGVVLQDQVVRVIVPEGPKPDAGPDAVTGDASLPDAPLPDAPLPDADAGRED